MVRVSPTICGNSLARYGLVQAAQTTIVVPL
jgi:hypothetical protein